jgi:hypothetical protein
VSAEARRAEGEQSVSGRFGHNFKIIEAHVLTSALVSGEKLHTIDIGNIGGSNEIVSAASSKSVRV